MKKMRSTRRIGIFSVFIILLTGCSLEQPVNEKGFTNESLFSGFLTKDSKESKEDEITDLNISSKVKEYILKGQKEIPDAEKLKWDEEFLNRIDIENAYQSYLSKGGDASDIEVFAQFLTEHAPIIKNWKELITKKVFDVYGKKASRFEMLEDFLYQVYVEINGVEVVYVIVSARTGYFHG